MNGEKSDEIHRYLSGYKRYFQRILEFFNRIKRPNSYSLNEVKEVYAQNHQAVNCFSAEDAQ